MKKVTEWTEKDLQDFVVKYAYKEAEINSVIS